MIATNNEKLKSLWDPNSQSLDKLTIRRCLVEMLESQPDIQRIAKELEVYKDKAIPVLIEALNLKYTEAAFMFSNAKDLLEILGNHRAIPAILENFNEHIAHFYVTGLLTKIGVRENIETRNLITDYLIHYLETKRKPPSSSYKEQEYYINAGDILEALRILGPIYDNRLVLILEKFIAVINYDSDLFQLALLTLKDIDPTKAVSSLNRKMDILKANNKNLQMKVVSYEKDDQPDSAYFTVCVKSNLENSFEDYAYTFKYEKPLVYFLKEGKEDHQNFSRSFFKLLAGGAHNKENAINVSLDYLQKWLPKIEIKPEKYKECITILQNHFDFEAYGFHQSYMFSRDFPLIIYDSEWCRLKLLFSSSGDRHDFSTYLHISYGRLHAPSNNDFMILDGEKYWCWHRVDHVLNFLDGLSPEEAVQVEYSPYIIKQYRDSDKAKNLANISQAEWAAGMHSEIWKVYGKRLFEVFDLRHPELWENYTKFMQEILVLKKSKSHYYQNSYYPSMDKIF